MGETLHQIMGRHRAEPLPARKPSWLKVKAPGGPNYVHLKNMVRELDLHTVCEEAHGRPPKFDEGEPARVADATGRMSLRHLVLTSVDRDDLPDFGAWAFAETVRLVHERVPDCSVEVLVPDFQGNVDSIRTVLEARPEIYNHNTETVPRLYKKAR